MGPTVDAGLRARTWLAEHSDDDVLDVAWSCAPDVTEERHGRPGAEDPSVILVRQGGGLGRVVRAGTVLAAYLGVADGELTARAALDAIAALLGLDADAVRAELVPAGARPRRRRAARLTPSWRGDGWASRREPDL